MKTVENGKKEKGNPLRVDRYFNGNRTTSAKSPSDDFSYPICSLFGLLEPLSTAKDAISDCREGECSPPFPLPPLKRLLNFPKHIHVRRTKVIKRDLFRRNPFQILVLQKLRRSLCNSGIINRQSNGNVRIFMNHLTENSFRLHANSQFLLAFPDQCFFTGFSRLQFSADKFPQSSPRAFCSGR